MAQVSLTGIMRGRFLCLFPSLIAVELYHLSICSGLAKIGGQGRRESKETTRGWPRIQGLATHKLLPMGNARLKDAHRLKHLD